MFKLTSNFKATGDQPQAIEKLVRGVEKGHKNQVLLGVTGSGKTFTMANIINKSQMPSLIISHNKTLAGQLYQEFREFFPENAVSYFVSYYDYYQPEAYMPATDTYIEKEAEINELIDKLRLQASTNILTRKDVIVIASVSCIYNIGSPKDYDKYIFSVKVGDLIIPQDVFVKLTQLQYDRSEFEFKRGTFRVRGETIDIYPAYEDVGYRLEIKSGKVLKITRFDPLTGKQEDKKNNSITIYPAKHFMMDPDEFKTAEQQIRTDLKNEYEALLKQNKTTEAERLLRRVSYDLEMIKEVGYVNGIENYSRYFDGRAAGDPPFSLINYFKEAYGDNFLTFIDESHMTIPQIRGMYNGDNARKKMLIDFGFRLQAAYDNRPLKFNEFYNSVNRFVYVSATPNDWELELAGENVAEQLVRPTGIVDPKVTIRPSTSEVEDLIKELEIRAAKGQKTLVTTLTKKTAEDLATYLKDKSVRASYLHSDIKTLERTDVLDNLRKNEFDVLIGVNLLREGLDIPEVTLVAILDADREGFLRSKTSLIQTMGRAARNVQGEVILYADKLTTSITAAISEISRRRKYQLKYNKKHNIDPTTILKPLRDRITDAEEQAKLTEAPLLQIDLRSMTPYDKKRTIKLLEREMKREAENLNFELAIQLRDKARELKNE